VEPIVFLQVRNVHRRNRFRDRTDLGSFP